MSARRLLGGIVAHNDEERVAGAIRSLLDQELPEGTTWQRLRVVASGCTDATVARAAAVDPRVEVLEESDRRGKSAALRTILESGAGATHLVLLNADAEAMAGSVARLLEAGDRHPPPWAAMPRLWPPTGRSGGFSESIELLWELHHAFHAHMSALGTATNLSDELLVLPALALPPLRPGIVNDGSFIGAWLSRQKAPLLYVPSAGVRIETVRRFRDHVAQRRRIRFGHGQILQMERVAPMTLQRWALRHPGDAARFLHRIVRARPHGYRALLPLLAAEGAALAGMAWDRLPPEPDHARWVRVPTE